MNPASILCPETLPSQQSVSIQDIHSSWRGCFAEEGLPILASSTTRYREMLISSPFLGTDLGHFQKRVTVVTGEKRGLKNQGAWFQRRALGCTGRVSPPSPQASPPLLASPAQSSV